ncbi:MAG: ATP-grasp domain-containing protein [Actinobacteria bacterium]|nr:ATP-grasp domain-containing protein [Actinomycetota bacterium]
MSETQAADVPPHAGPRAIIVVCAQERDRRLIRAAGLDSRYRVRYAGPDLDAVADFDAETFLAGCAAARADGVVGTKDRSALLASLVAERKRLAGPAPAALINCQHKGRSRVLQRQAAPAATPVFAVLDGAGAAPPQCPPPWFAKPIVGRLSQGTRRIDDRSELANLADSSGYPSAYARIARFAGLPAAAVNGFLVEELCRGAEVTLEGYAYAGRVIVIGVTDSIMYPGTNSFQRFEYPSAISAARFEELSDLARRLIPALGLDGGFFNIEFVVPPEGPATIIEVNARIASQFAPMVEALHGRSTYEALFELACGRDPMWKTSRPDGVAVSYVLRTFADAVVESVPEPQDDVEILVRPGLRLSEQGPNDTESYRLAIAYGVGETRDEAVERCRSRLSSLRFDFASARVA